eukprot:329377-Amphidinium_carterae.1
MFLFEGLSCSVGLRSILVSTVVELPLPKSFELLTRRNRTIQRVVHQGPKLYPQFEACVRFCQGIALLPTASRCG